ncbi:MAG: hypothetical protein ABUT20_29520 [Bacteroidota bacterium]
MNFQQFELLPYSEKMDFIESNCALVAERFVGYCCFELYQYGEWYFEMQVYVGMSIYWRCFCFDDTFYLDPYLERIDISKLVADLSDK